MVTIDETGFADRINQYLENPPILFNHDVVESTLNKISPLSRHNSGIRFGHNTELVMKLFARAYHCLNDSKISKEDFSEKMAVAIQDFAKPFPEGDNLCYPHFLLHGIAQPTIDSIVEKIGNNSRIIHETLIVQRPIIIHYGVKDLRGVLLRLCNGGTDDYFGICHFLFSSAQEPYASRTSGYIAKASFFVDTTKKELYVITIQGRRYEALGKSEDKNERIREGEHLYSKIGAILGMSPRRFILSKVMEFGRDNGYKKIKVIKPTEHPMFIESHKGFLGNYEPVILQAGISQKHECYLEKEL